MSDPYATLRNFGVDPGHFDHPWQQVGPCVWCGPCRERLYQGRMPEGHPVHVPPRVPAPADVMRAKWGKT